MSRMNYCLECKRSFEAVPRFEDTNLCPDCMQASVTAQKKKQPSKRRRKVSADSVALPEKEKLTPAELGPAVRTAYASLSFPQEMQFKYPWRKYQLRALQDMYTHLCDKRLHIVAAPGSGKTVLGLEVIRRINRPTLILSPTITIKQQWIDRLVTLFLPEGSTEPEWVSHDIASLKYLTTATYQALHTAYTGAVDADQETDDASAEHTVSEKNGKARRARIINALRAADIGLVVIDEAHHLRNEWWKTLADIVSYLNDPAVMALTATPPYDVEKSQWARYKFLCGPIDAEIPVPELVKSGDLCPHQDYVRLSVPTATEAAMITRFAQTLLSVKQSVLCDERFTALLRSHPWFIDTGTHIEAILEDPGLFSALLVVLAASGTVIPETTIRIIGGNAAALPPIDDRWLEQLLNGVLFNEAFNASFADNVYLRELKSSFAKAGGIERGVLYLRHTPSIGKTLTASLSKLGSIVDIVRLEYGAMGAKLRLVIISDNIRREFLPKPSDTSAEINRMGVVPIFEMIRRASIPGIRPCILSGSLVVIPAAASDKLHAVARSLHIPRASLTTEPLAGDTSFVLVQCEGADERKTVALITGLLLSGEVNVLVGTQALLGEGWDAPEINTLIMASTVGTFMLSNQIRGRAIRSVRGDPEKTANIWHLACVAPSGGAADDDIANLRRRFDAFVGPSHDAKIIRNGMDRVGIPRIGLSEDAIRTVNAATDARAVNRTGMRQQWQESLDTGTSLDEELVFTKPRTALPARFVFTHTIASLALESLFILADWGFISLRSAASSKGDLNHIVSLLIFGCSIGAVAALPGALRALILLLKHGTLEGRIRQVGESLLDALCNAAVVTTDRTKLSITTERHDGQVACTLYGGTVFERRQFIECLDELLGPVTNQRYIVLRKRPFGIGVQLDYHPVPDIIGRKKEWAEYFCRVWTKRVCPVSLIFTRTAEGRLTLLRARTGSLYSKFQDDTEIVSRWQ